MFSEITKTIAGRAPVAFALAFAWLLANPLLPAGFGPGAANIGAAFARHGADDGPNHDVNDDHGRHHRHGNDDGVDHDVNDDHGGRQPGHK